MKILSGIAVLSVLLLAACSSAEPKDEVVANGGAGKTGVINDVPATPAPEEKRDPKPEGYTETFTIGAEVDEGLLIKVIDRMDEQGCLFERVALTKHKQWGQFVLKCSDPVKVPAVE